MAIAAARQATPSAVAIGRTNSRMEVSQGLDGFQLGHERPEDGQTTIKPIWRQIMAETNQDGRASKQRKPPDKKTPPPRGEAAFCSIMTRKEELPCPWQACSDLLSQGLSHSTIGAEEFNGRVRDGIGFKLLARTTRPAKDKETKQAVIMRVYTWTLKMRAIKPIERLVPVSYTHYCASTPGLSTWWSTTVLKGILVLRWVSRLDAFSGYPVRT